MSELDSECVVFSRYLIGQSPGEYVLSKYREFHQLSAAGKEMQARPFDRTLLAVARVHPAATRLADAYARIALPAGLLRKKLVLTLAILESGAPSHRFVDDVDPAGGARLWARLFLTVAFSGGILLTSVALFAPWHLLSAAATKAWGRQEAAAAVSI
jgi:hypothetical protein